MTRARLPAADLWARSLPGRVAGCSRLQRAGSSWNPVSLAEPRFNRSGVGALCHARLQVSVRRSRSVEPEHLLLGLLRAERQLIASHLKNGWTVARLKSALKARLTPEGPDEVPHDVDVPYADATKQLIVKASHLAAERGRTELSSLHLLAALVQDNASSVGQLLRESGLSEEELLNEECGKQ
jgi:ATP-dependent Clp protease ATP-binding subunit ClpA